MPFFLLALPGGAMADIVDRRVFLIGTQVWTIRPPPAAGDSDHHHMMNAGWLLVLTFAIGIGSALTDPAWSAIVPELVPREDLVQAIALNGIGFNLTRAMGPALAGFLDPAGRLQPGVLAVCGVDPRGDRRAAQLASRAAASPACRASISCPRCAPACASSPTRRRCSAAMVRTFAYAIPASAPWALLPLVVREQLGLGAGMYGVILGMMGVGGVTSGMLLPNVRGTAVTQRDRVRLQPVLLRRHGDARPVASLGCRRRSACRCSASAGSPPSPPSRPRHSWSARPGCGPGRWRSTSFPTTARWPSARSAGAGSARRSACPDVLLAAAAGGAVLAVAVRASPASSRSAAATAARADRAPAAARGARRRNSSPLLRMRAGRLMETMHYRATPDQREHFLQAMAEVRMVRGRAGALFWQLYEDVAHPDGWMETWAMESWIDHLREATRLSDADQAALAAAVSVFQQEARPAVAVLRGGPAGISARSSSRWRERAGRLSVGPAQTGA